MARCETCMTNPIYPDKKCCFNCARVNTNCEVWHNCGEDCPGWESKIKTNADRIRAMSDGELAWFLAEMYANEAVLRARDSGHEPTATEIKAVTERLYYTWVRWLKQDVQT